MSTRQTSIDCYNQIKTEGLLSKLRLRTLNAMLYSAPCTAGELQSYIDKNQIQVKHAWKLLSQLRDIQEWKELEIALFDMHEYQNLEYELCL